MTQYKGFTVTLGVSDLKNSLDFYRAALQLEREPYESDEIVFFAIGNGVYLALFPRTELAKDALTNPKGDGFEGITLAFNVGSSSEAAEVLKRAVSAGGTLVKPGQQVPWGGFSGYFADPDGHLWEIACGSEDYQKELELS